MYNNAPSDYICPICLGINGIESEKTLLNRQDLIYKDNLTSVFVNSFFVEGNEGHLIVVPNQHIENIYDLDTETGKSIIETTKKMAILLKKTFKCDGTTLRQNNEPAGDQHAFHFHLQIFPRYKNDNFNMNSATKKLTTPEERQTYIIKLKSYLD